MGAIRLKTEIPGPRSRALMQAREQAVVRGIYHAAPIFLERAQGVTVEDVDGNQFLDFAGGLGALNIGHAAARVRAAVQQQLERFTHGCILVTPYECYVQLAEALNQRTPGRFPKKTFLLNSGSEAIENAIKIARFATGRPAVICFEDAFHGRTLGALSLTSKTHPYKHGFGPFLPEVYRIPYAYCYRCSYRLEYPACELHCAHYLEEVFRRVVAAEAVAAVVVEPVLGEGGFVVPPPEFLPILQDICRRRGILLIADEVQTGFGRTGKLFASEWFGLEPDLLLAAKSIAGGLPLAAIVGRAELMDQPGVGALGGTFGGNPLSCAAALAVLEELEQGRLLERAGRIGERFRARAERWRTELPLVGEARGLGAMQALELVRNRTTREPAKEETAEVARHCYERGLLTITAGTFGNVIRTLMPLVISDDELDEGLTVLEGALREVSARVAQPARR